MGGLSRLLADHRFAELFREELGWDRASGTIAIQVYQRRLTFEAIAQNRGLQVFHCIADRRVLLNRGLLYRTQGQISRTVQEHILIYSCTEPPIQVWQWAVRMLDGRRVRHREYSFVSNSPPATFLDRLSSLRLSFDEESDVLFGDALYRVRAALDAAPDLNSFAKGPWCAERSDELAVAMTEGEADAFSQFIRFHRPLARHIAKRLQRWYGMEADDADQIGVIGLIQAARRFNPDRGYRFCTYATYCIRRACQRFGPEAALFIRLPASDVNSLFPIRRHLERLRTEFGPGRANDELARLCMEDPRFFRRWLRFQRAVNVRSLSDRHEHEYSEARTVKAPVNDDPLHEQLHKERVEGMLAALECLDLRDRRFLRLRYGMEGDPQTLQEIAQTEGITRERVRQILLRAEERLRRFVTRKLPDLVPLRPAVPNSAENEIKNDPV
jgi:RNA polymerase primary sigma factor